MTSVRGDDFDGSETDDKANAAGAADSRSATRGGATKAATPWWKEGLILVGTALVLALIIKTFFVQAFYIPSGSMERTLEVNDRILVQKVSYWFGSPQRGDIIVFDDPASWLAGEAASTEPGNPVTKALSFIGLYPAGGHLVKRVIGIGGDQVRCSDGVVQVNKVDLHESSYVTLPSQACTGVWSVVVPPDHLWVLGDNRNDSADSRVHMGDPGGGFIPADDVVGKVFVTVWPADRWRLFHRPATFSNPDLNAAALVARDVFPMGAFLVLIPTLYRRATVRHEDDPDADVETDPDRRDARPAAP